MKELLEKIFDQRRNGLYFVNTPTGSAKSYSAVQMMKNNYKTFDKHFIFITNNLNNLPMEDLKDALGEDEYKANVLRVESIVDNIVHHFYEARIPDEFQVLDSYKNLEMRLNIYKHFQNELKTGRIGMKLLQDSQKNLAEADGKFRKEIKKVIMSTDIKNHSMEERKEMIKSKYQWLGTLYPAMFVEDYKVICMSVKRFFTTIDPIYMGDYKFSESDIIDNSVLFIDEVDATKNEINNIIIENSLKSTIDLIPLVHRITSPFIQWQGNTSNKVKGLIPDNDKQLNDIINKAMVIRNNYHDELSYYCDEIKQRNFLMSDSTFHANFENNSKKNAYIYYDQNDNQMTIKIENKRDDLPQNIGEAYNLYSVIRDMSSFLVSVKRYVNKLASNYKKIRNSKVQEEDYITDEEAIRSIYRMLKIPNSDIKYFEDEINIQPVMNVNRTSNRLKKMNSYYDRGIRSFEFTNRKDNSFNTAFSYIHLNKSAESILALLASKATVIGLSASCNIDSVLSNYSLKYLKETLEDNFHLIEEEDRLRIQETYSFLNRKYETGEIQVRVEEVLDSQEKDIKTLIGLVFDDPKIKNKLYKMFNLNGVKDSYCAKRYLRMAQVYRYFIQHEDIKSFLCLNNALPRDKGDFRLSILDELFKTINEECGFKTEDKNYEVLKSGATFEKDKDNILERLHCGEKIFVISAYATIGAGQNMAYELPENLDTINLTDFSNKKDGRNKKKDFDGIFLGDITNVVSNLYNTEFKFQEADLLRYIIQVENLYHNNEINHYALSECISAGYKKLKDPTVKWVKTDIKGCRSIRLSKTKQIIQAIGRLSRSFNKNKVIHILVTKDIVNSFDTSILETEILSPETIKLAEYAKERQEDVPVYDYVENEASHISSEGKFYIYEFLSGDWTPKEIESYKKLGETCLKHPTISNKDDEIVKEYYIHSSEPMNKYYFIGENDFEYTDVFFNQSKDEVILRLQNKEESERIKYIHEVSEENARLSKMLNYPGLREEFIKHEYATCFEVNDYMLSPVLFQNIYKGRLGEFVGHFIIKQELGIDLDELEPYEYERFDYKHGKVYIDLKHWRYSNFNAEKMNKKIIDKLNEIGGEKAIIINIFDENKSDKIIESPRLIEIPSLLEEDGFHANREAINKIRMCLEEYKDD